MQSRTQGVEKLSMGRFKKQLPDIRGLILFNDNNKMYPVAEIWESRVLAFSDGDACPRGRMKDVVFGLDWGYIVLGSKVVDNGKMG